MPSILTAFALVATILRPQAEDPERLRTNLDSLVLPLVQAHDFAGTVLVARGADTLLLASYGLADVEAGRSNSGSTPMRVGSISKQFTAAAILLLQEDGLLDVYDPLTRFLPGFPSGDSIRLHDLLAHRAGVVRDVFEDWTERQSPRTLDALVSEISRQPLDFEPRSRISYSNAGYTLLAAVVELASGMLFADFLDRRVFDPLQMRHTGIWDDLRADESPDRLARGYDPGPNPGGLVMTPREDPSNTLGADGIASTVGDLHIWSEALESDVLLSKQSREQMFTVYGDGRGYGVGIGSFQGAPAVGHDGVTHGFISFVERHFATDVTLTLLGNIRTGVLTPLRNAIRSIAYDEDFETIAPPRPGPPPAKGLLDSAVGAYPLFPGMRVEISRVGDDLYLLGTGGYPTALVPLGGDDFFYRARYETIRFERDGDGVTGLVWIDQAGQQYPAPKSKGGQRS